jgi:hypothetical protein
MQDAEVTFEVTWKILCLNADGQATVNSPVGYECIYQGVSFLSVVISFQNCSLYMIEETT